MKHTPNLLCHRMNFTGHKPFIFLQKLIVCCFLSLLFLSSCSLVHANTYDSTDDYSFVILSTYKEAVNIDDEFYLFAFTSTGKKPTFKSSDSKIATVNTYGLVKAKKEGTVTITAKIKNAEASCVVTVAKTKVNVNKKSISLECQETFQLDVTTSNGAPIKYKSNKSSVASVDETGLITAKKPGEAIITIKANTTSITCTVKVKQPTLKLNKTKATLFRTQTLNLSCDVSSGKTPIWKSNRKSVATVDEFGVVTAHKHGTAIITAKVDGVSKTCEIIVKQPSISLNDVDLILIEGETYQLTASVSSGNLPTWSTSNTSIATVEDGLITAVSHGTAYIYAKEDGSKARCKVKVIAPK